MESTWWALFTNEDTFTDFEGGMMNKSYKQNNLIDVVEDVPTINCADVNAVLPNRKNQEISISKAPG